MAQPTSSAAITIVGTKNSLLSGSQNIGPLTILNSPTVDQDQTAALTTGANTITVPTGAVAFVLVPPAGNAVQITLKGVTGDTGILLHLTNPTGPVSLAVAQTTFVLNAASNVTVALQWV